MCASLFPSLSLSFNLQIARAIRWRKSKKQEANTQYANEFVRYRDCSETDEQQQREDKSNMIVSSFSSLSIDEKRVESVAEKLTTANDANNNYNVSERMIEKQEHDSSNVESQFDSADYAMILSYLEKFGNYLFPKSVDIQKLEAYLMSSEKSNLLRLKIILLFGVVLLNFVFKSLKSAEKYVIFILSCFEIWIQAEALENKIGNRI